MPLLRFTTTHGSIVRLVKLVLSIDTIRLAGKFAHENFVDSIELKFKGRKGQNLPRSVS